MIVSAIGAGSPNYYPQIGAASFSRVPAISSFEPRQPADEFLPSEDLLGSLAAEQAVAFPTSTPAEVTQKPESPLPGTSYGMSAQELRQTAMRLQLLGETTASEYSPLSAATTPADATTAGAAEAANVTQRQTRSADAGVAVAVTPSQPAATQPEVVTPELEPEAAQTVAPAAGLAATGQETTDARTPAEESETSGKEDGETGEKTATSTEKDSSGQELTEDERKDIDQLKQRDKEVRVHEQAHMAAAGAYANGGPSFSYQSGPDGKRYAIGGSVSIDTSPENTPEATIRKMQTVRAAALAPAEPSGQDRSVAAQAAAAQAQASAELMQNRSEEAQAKRQPDEEDRQTGEGTASADGSGAPETAQGVSGPASAQGQDGDSAGQNGNAGGGLPSLSDLIAKQRQAQQNQNTAGAANAGGANAAVAAGTAAAETAKAGGSGNAPTAPISRLSYQQMNIMRAYGLAG